MEVALAATAAAMPGVTTAPDVIDIDFEFQKIRACPPTKIGRNWGGVGFLLDSNPWEVVVKWNDYENQSKKISVIPLADIVFEN